ncbi:fungal hydrophobin [Flagelloscypha sp. PMI_526]|nr:fungal hydrophobin [Flagelloscypha sp. PMI_526]
MRSFVTIIFVALLAFLVSAKPMVDTNARRMARGLPLKAPRHLYRASPAAMARRSQTSGTSTQCSTGSPQCCQTVGPKSDPEISFLLGLLTIDATNINGLVGKTCSPITAVGVGSGTCNQKRVCCEDNSHGGLISIDCTPVNL